MIILVVVFLPSCDSVIDMIFYCAINKVHHIVVDCTVVSLCVVDE